jgi:hypothetical protein
MRPRFGSIFLWAFAVLLLASRVNAQAREEFNGPFKGWANVKHGFGAKGNGKDDDTKALQNAIDYLSVPPKGFGMGAGAYTVVYLPAGTYCISSTLQLRGKIGISIIGEDPERTIIKWMGKDSSTAFRANGSAYFRISRLSWDAGGKTNMEAIGIHWKNVWNDYLSRSFAVIHVEISDNCFIGGFRTGISGGTTPATGTGANDSEITIRRCLFHNCTFSGIEIMGFNALDYWIWDCRFLHCANGVRCTFGNYHIYRSFFSGSTVSDVHNNNGYYNSIRGCYSVNANAFSSDEGASSNPFKRVFQDNTVIAPHDVPIRHNHLGKITLFGNAFTRNIDTTYKFSVYNRSWFPGIYEALSLHNIYAYAQPIKLDVDPHKLYSFADRVGAAIHEDTLAFLRSMDPTPLEVTRKVFELFPGADAARIQQVLDSAAAMQGQRPVVHFHVGVYTIDRTLKIPAGADMQLTGDGWLYSTMIQQKDLAVFRKTPLLEVEGPSYITIRDIHFGNVLGKGQLAGIVFKNVDQPRAEVHIDQVYAPGVDTSLFVRDMNYLYVQKDNSFFTTGNYISGGTLVQQNKGTARVCCYGGQFAHLFVEQNGRFMAKDCWWEGADHLPLNLSGSGTISIDGAMIAPYKQDSTTTVNIGKFNGSISLMNMYLQGALSAGSDNPGLNLLVWNIHFYYKMNALAFLEKGATYKAAFLGLNAQCFRAKDPACRVIICIDDRLQNIGDLNSFLDKQTAPTRDSRPVLYANLPAGVSNIYISRVSFGTMGRGLSFEAL